MSEKDDIWLYLTNQSSIDSICQIDLDDMKPTSFQSYLHMVEIYSTKCQFITLGKVMTYRDLHPELRPWRNGYLCFYSLNFAFEAKNIELLVALRQLLQVPSATRLVPHVAKYMGTRKEAADDMDRYFRQYNNHVTIKGVHFVILHKYEMPYVRQFFRKANMNWVDHHYETWEHIRPTDLVSSEEEP